MELASRTGANAHMYGKIKYQILMQVQHGLSAHDRLAIYVARHITNQVVEEGSGFCYGWSSYVRGYHEYKERWTPSLGEMLELKVEPMNAHDQFVTAVIKPDGTVVGHIYKYASKAVLLWKAGSAGFCEVNSSSVNLGVGLGLKTQCNYKFYGCQAYVDRLQTLLS